MRDAPLPPRRTAAGPARLLLLALLVHAAVGCAGREAQQAGASTEREETRGGRRYRLKSSLAPRRATLGDPLRWTLAAELPAAAAPGKLLRGRTAPELDVVAPKEPESRREGARRVWTWTYEVRGFTLGRIPLPTVLLPVQAGTARDTLLFPADSVAIDSLTPVATGAVLPDRGPIAPKLRPVDYAVAGLLGLVLLALVILGIRALRRRGRRATVSAVPPEPPETLLRRALADLRATGEPLPRDRFYERLSLAIRDYAAAATGITTRDRTTAEIVRALKSERLAAPEGIDALAGALARSDLAKFARRGGAWEEALDVLATAERLPEQLPVRVPATPSPEPAEPAAPAPRAAGEGRR